jgi:hypothetical protein
MADPYWNGTEWDNSKTYSEGDQVTYEGYKYQAMTSISAGDNPRTATYSTLGGTFRKWKVWDYPSFVIMARLRGVDQLAFADILGVESPMPYEVRTICVRNFYQNGASPDQDLYSVPTSMSQSGYGMPQGMDSNWDDPEDWDSVYAPSAAAYEDGAPKSYNYNLGADDGIVFQPNTVAALILSDFNPSPATEDYLAPAWSTETLGQMVSCYQTFSREYGFALIGTPPYAGDESNTTSFQDNWVAQRPWTGYDGAFFIKYTDPNFKDV